MRSLYTRIFLTGCATLLLALGAFLTVSLTTGNDRYVRNIAHVFDLEMSLGSRIYQEQGPAALAAFMKSTDVSFASRHYFVDRFGRDLVTGEDRSMLLASRSARSRLPKVIRSLYRFVGDVESTFVVRSSNGDFGLVVTARPWSEARTQFPFYLAVLIVVSVLNSLVAVRIVSSLRAIAGAAKLFGEGSLEARVEDASRHDEVGLVATEFNRMADRVRELVLSERRLLQDVSHELRSPLARLTFAAELAKTSPNRDKAIELVQSQIRTLAALVSSLLVATRVGDDHSSQSAASVPLAEVIAEVVSTNALNAHEKRCRIAVDAACTGYIRGDRTLLARALDNVLRNAIEYSPQGGRVDVCLREVSGRAVLSVRDFGAGVPEAMLASIFEPFFRVDESRQQSTGGVGLGLAIVQRAVHSHGGGVQATNAAPGLMVTMTLPDMFVETPEFPDRQHNAASRGVSYNQDSRRLALIARR